MWRRLLISISTFQVQLQSQKRFRRRLRRLMRVTCVDCNTSNQNALLQAVERKRLQTSTLGKSSNLDKLMPVGFATEDQHEQKYHTLEDWRAIIGAQEASGESVMTFCQQHGIRPKYFWNRRRPCGELVQPLINRLSEQILDQNLVAMDESTVRVLEEPGKPAQSTSYMWVMGAGPPNRRLLVYHYAETPLGQDGDGFARRLLRGLDGRRPCRLRRGV